MKIDAISVKQRPEALQETPRQGRTEGRSAFESLLDQEIGAAANTPATDLDVSRTGDIAKNAAIYTASPLPSISRVSEADYGHITSLESRLSQVHSLLDSAAGNPRKLESVIQMLAKESESLSSEVSSLPGHHPLKAVAEEFELLAYVESIKWQRGDYL